ncbi:hypothetical protein [Columbia Basin potato purple top phytoplasma]|uniref:Uncharacterized protein n=1 Tax=Columbia Basin potato purple top phytoplasma TaxID=307134 RepID=A0ABT5LAB0_9MOLU|nr:hypothetical protein [Columbia Basin potato purple top phytoplasma]MDC9032086.1 hypothetical protein [Columbia Basin potato purple top phytoplasma]
MLVNFQFIKGNYNDQNNLEALLSNEEYQTLKKIDNIYNKRKNK